MKIVHLSCVAPPYQGGIGRVAFEEVTRLQHRGHEAVLYAPIGGGSPDVIRRMPSRLSIGNAAMVVRQRAFDEVLFGADIVHLHYPFYGTSGLIAKLRREGKIKRLVLTLHMDAKADGLKGLVFDLHRRFRQTRILDSADALLVSSRDYAEHSSFAPWVERVIELPFGVDEDRFHPGEKDRSSFGLPDDAFVVSFVGGMDVAHAFKGIDVLMRAIAQLPPTVYGLFVGGGSSLHTYIALAKELGIAERVKFLGDVPDGQLPSVYRAADVHAVPSISGAEAFSLVAVEAQASGIPVVASDLPGVRTVVVNGVTGTLVTPTDVAALTKALGDLQSDHESRLKMGEAAHARVLAKFTWAKHMDGLIDTYQNVCASPS